MIIADPAPARTQGRIVINLPQPVLTSSLVVRILAMHGGEARPCLYALRAFGP